MVSKSLLRGQQEGQLKIILDSKLQKSVEKDPKVLGQPYLLSSDYLEISTSPQLRPLLDSFADVFEEPKGLSPPRAQDHSIPLKLINLPIIT